MIYLTSDTHFGHPLCAVLRGFLNDTPEARTFADIARVRGSIHAALPWCNDHHVALRDIADVDSHDTVIANGIRNVVGASDELWILGDLAFRCGWQKLEPILESLCLKRSNMHLVMGNHDGCFPLNGNVDSRHCSRERLDKYFSSIDERACLDVSRYGVRGVKKLMLSHFPWREASEMSNMVPRRAELIDVMPCKRDAKRGTWLAYGHTHSADWDQYADFDAIHIGCDSWGLLPVSLDEVMNHIVEVLSVR